MSRLATGVLQAAAGPSEALLAALLPPHCGLCDVSLDERSRYGICPRCLEQVAANDAPRCLRCDLPGALGMCPSCTAAPPPFAAVVAPYLYGGSLADLISLMKFSRREDLAAGLGRLLADQPRVRAAVCGAQIIVPVPLGWRRRRQRGFNQSAILARTLGREFGIKVAYALRRRRNTRAQSDLPVLQRRSNMIDALVGRHQVQGRCILVDDVVTSGETVREAASALRAAGADEVAVVALARTPLQS